MMSKKDAITLAVLGVAGIAAASAVAGGGTPTGGGAAMEGRVGRILGSQEGYGDTPKGSVYQIPAAAAVTFPKAVDYTDFLRNFLAPTSAPPSRGSQGVSAEPKKYRDTGNIAFGYKGYVTPIIPTPIKPSNYADYEEAYTAYYGEYDALKDPAGTFLGRLRGWTPEKGKKAWERGKKQEIESSMYLAGHPSLTMEEGVIVKKHSFIPKSLLTTKGQAVKETVARRQSSSGVSVSSTKKSVSTPKATAKATSRRADLVARARAASGR